MEQVALVLFENNVGEILLHLKDNKQELLFANEWSLLEGSSGESGEGAGQMVRSIMEDFSIHPSSFKYFNSYKHYSEKHKTQFEIFVFVCKANLPILKVTLHEGQKINYVHPRDIASLELPQIIEKIIRDYVSKKNTREIST
ncbi:MAG: hypothetical protein RI947_252 [Candidatus Parcubacteria bacterium]|jgi:hypothetical protein